MDYVLYIISRTDLPSLNPGKAMAQCAHAANAFVEEIRTKHSADSHLALGYNDWKDSTNQGFGTTIVLGGTVDEIIQIVKDKSFYETDLAMNYVEDPTYPYMVDKEVVHLLDRNKITAEPVLSGDKFVVFRREITCGYVFGPKDTIQNMPEMKKLSLHP